MRASPPPSLLRLGQLMPELMRLLHRDVTGENLARMNDHSLTLPQLVALQVLREDAPCSISSLCEVLRLSTSATSHLIDRLVDRGLVAREEDPSDRRQKRLTLTAAGRALVDDIAATRIQDLARGLGSVDPALLDALSDLVEQIIAQLRASPPLPR